VFWLLVERFEEQRRRGDWVNAHRRLDDAERACLGDARRAADVAYRRAHLYLEQATAQRPAQRDPAGVSQPDFAQRAVTAATEAVLLLGRMDNRVGVVRARLLRVRALVIVGDLLAASSEQHQCAGELQAPELTESPALIPLQARAHWATGVLRRAEADPVWRRELEEAKRLFQNIDDGRSHRRVESLLKTSG
jgi:hypothetical protein